MIEDLHHVAFSEVNIRAAGGVGGPGDDDEENLAFTLELEEIGPQQRHVSLKVFPFHDIELTKRLLLKKLGKKQIVKISDIEIFYNGIDVPNRRLMIAFANADVVHLKWRMKDRISRGVAVRDIRVRSGANAHPRIIRIINDLSLSFQKKVNPKLSDEGTGGTYMLYNLNGRPLAVFKPTDEEAFAPNNPRNYIGKFGQRGFRLGVVSGEGSLREVAAFLMDAYYGSFSGVPATALVEMIHPHLCYDPFNPRKTRDSSNLALLGGVIPRKKKKDDDNIGQQTRLEWKVGSLQEFIPAKDSSSDYDPRLFSVGDVHRIAILDIRLANMDRNDGNILVLKTEDADLFHISEDLLHPSFAKNRPNYQTNASLTPDGKVSKYRLIPIDHGLTLPDCLDLTDFDLAWLNWPQAHTPLLLEEIEYIMKLRPDSDAEWLLNKLEIRSPCLRVMQVTTRLLQKGASAGLTLHQIALLMVRYSPDEPSPLEKAIRLALSQACFATYATALVHKRDPGMKYAMDLAGSVGHNFLPGHKMMYNNNNKDNNNKDLESVSAAGGSVDNNTSRSNLSAERSGGSSGRKFVHWLGSHDDGGGSYATNQSSSRLPSSKRQQDLFATDGASSPNGSSRPRSKTISRLINSDDRLTAAFPTSTARRGFKNYTTLRPGDRGSGDLSNSVSGLWVTQDSGGRKISPDWSDSRFQRLFFESLDSIIDFLISEKIRFFNGAVTPTA